MLQRLVLVPTGFTLIGNDGIERVFEEEIRAQSNHSPISPRALEHRILTRPHRKRH